MGEILKGNLLSFTDSVKNIKWKESRMPRPEGNQRTRLLFKDGKFHGMGELNQVDLVILHYLFPNGPTETY